MVRVSFDDRQTIDKLNYVQTVERRVTKQRQRGAELDSPRGNRSRDVFTRQLTVGIARRKSYEICICWPRDHPSIVVVTTRDIVTRTKVYRPAAASAESEKLVYLLGVH